MTEEQAVDEQSKNAPAEEEESTFGRMKSKVKDLVGSDSDDERDSEAQSSGEEASEEDDSSNTEAEGSDEESASGDEEDSEEEEEEGTSVGTDEVEIDTIAQDEDTARAQIDKMEEDGPPEDLSQWPRGKAMYLSFGGAEGEEGYEEGPARQMGPSSLRHHADGSVEVQGEMVDNPDDYKADKSVGEEADEIGMDKGAKSEGDEGDESSSEEGASSEQGSSSDEGSSNVEAPQAESSDNANAEADGGDSHSDGSGSDQSEGQQTEGQPAEAS